MKDVLGYLLLPYREITSPGKLAGALLNVLWHVIVAYDRYGRNEVDAFGLFSRQFWFGVTLFLLGVQIEMIRVACGRYQQSGRLTLAPPAPAG